LQEMGQSGDKVVRRRLCWILWNDWIFNSERRSVQAIGLSVRAQVLERLVADEAQGFSCATGMKWVRWTPPPADVLKVNFNAALWDDGCSSVACVVRNSAGKLLLVAVWSCEYREIVDAGWSCEYRKIVDVERRVAFSLFRLSCFIS